MQVHINGEAQTLPAGSSVAALVEQLQLDAGAVAVEINLAIVPRSLHGETRISDGDRIEIVRFIGGG